MAMDPVKTTGLTFNGNNGEAISTPKTEEQQKLARAIARLDQRGDLSKTDIEKLRNMSLEEQIKYLNDALKDTGYQIADVYDSEEDAYSPGVNFTSDGVFINYSKGGKPTDSEDPNLGHFAIRFKKQ